MYRIPGYDVVYKTSTIHELVEEYKERLEQKGFEDNILSPSPFISFADSSKLSIDDVSWTADNHDRFIKDTPNEMLDKHDYLSQLGFIFCIEFSPDGSHLIVGHSTGLIQMRDGFTGAILCTLRSIQFPPKPVYVLHYSRKEEQTCYAACMDGAVYKIKIPINVHMNTVSQHIFFVSASLQSGPDFSIHVDSTLDMLNVQNYSSPGASLYSTPLFAQRYPVLSLGITSDNSNLICGLSDCSIKMYDMETMQTVNTYKVHKLRLQFIPKKLQRNHFGQVCALRCHDDKPHVFASGAWDNTLRIWDTRCKIGCVMTFECVNISADSLDINRDQCVTGSWTTTEALSVWDLVAKKRLTVVRVQNRRPDVDGEYIYTCRYWNSSDYNRKGKYAIIGGSGTKCVEVINLHNRYITCSYPAQGTVLAVTSHEDRIAFGGTATLFNLVTFHDPKHEKYDTDEEGNPYIFDLRDMDSDSIFSH